MAHSSHVERGAHSTVISPVYLFRFRWLTWANALILIAFGSWPVEPVSLPAILLTSTCIYNLVLHWHFRRPSPPVRPSRLVAVFAYADLLIGMLAASGTGGRDSPFYLYSQTSLFLPPYFLGFNAVLVCILALVVSHTYWLAIAAMPAATPLTVVIEGLTTGGALILAAYLLGVHDVLRWSAERRAIHLGILNKVAGVAAAVRESQDDLLDEITTIVHEELNWERFVVGLLEEGEIVVRAGFGLPAEWLGRVSTELGKGITGWVGETGQSLLVADTSQEPRYASLCAESRSLLCVPVRDGERIRGILHVESHQLNAFDVQDEQLLTALADDIGVGLSRIETAAQTHKLIEQETRFQMARYLHDETVQQVYGVILALKDHLRHLGSGQDRAQVETTLNLATRAWEDLRAYLQDLRSPVDEAALTDILKQRAAEFSRLTGLPVHVEIGGAEAMPSVEVRTCLSAIIRAALSNVYRHAKATTVWMRLCEEKADIVLEIQDDGIGFDPHGVDEAHGQLGLVGMRERAESMGGHLEIDSDRMNGTRLIVRLPLERRNDGEDYTAAR